jgi:hypothetical protein
MRIIPRYASCMFDRMRAKCSLLGLAFPSQLLVLSAIRWAGAVTKHVLRRVPVSGIGVRRLCVVGYLLMMYAVSVTLVLPWHCTAVCSRRRSSSSATLWAAQWLRASPTSVESSVPSHAKPTHSIDPSIDRSMPAAVKLAWRARTPVPKLSHGRAGTDGLCVAAERFDRKRPPACPRGGDGR